MALGNDRGEGGMNRRQVAKWDKNVTDGRIISAGRFFKPLSLDLEKLKGLRIKQNPLGRLIGYGTLVLLFRPPHDPGEGAFLRFELKKLPDASSLSSVILAAAGRSGRRG